MFKRLVSNLPYNPSLINRLSRYGAQLKREANLRRVGVTFLALALTLQLVAVLTAHGAGQCSSNAASCRSNSVYSYFNNVTYSASTLPLLIGAVVVFMASFFYLKTKVMAKEVEIIRKEHGRSGEV
jgi:hypothetical protein